MPSVIWEKCILNPCSMLSPLEWHHVHCALTWEKYRSTGQPITVWCTVHMLLLHMLQHTTAQYTRWFCKGYITSTKCSCKGHITSAHGAWGIAARVTIHCNSDNMLQNPCNMSLVHLSDVGCCFTFFFNLNSILIWYIINKQGSLSS